MAVEVEESVVHIENLRPFLPEKTQEELGEILAYWKKIKEEWEKKKKEFWWSGKRNFSELLRYKWVYQKELEKWYKYLDKMSDIEKEKFIEEYLYDDMLYDTDLKNFFLVSDTSKGKEYYYNHFKSWKILIEQDAGLYFSNNTISIDEIKKISKMKLKGWVKLFLNNCGLSAEWIEELVKNLKIKDLVTLSLEANQIWDEWAKVIAENLELKKWVELVLTSNGIWPGWAKAIAQNLKLKDWVVLSLHANPIWDKWVWYLSKMEMKEWVSLLLWGIRVWDEWIIELAKNLQLKEWVVLDLHVNNIWDKWAQALIDDLVLKGWVKLDLSYNSISKKMRDKLKKWAQDYNDKWLICEVLVD